MTGSQVGGCHDCGEMLIHCRCVAPALTPEELDALRFHQWCGWGVRRPDGRGTSYACDCDEAQSALVASALAKIAALLPPEPTP